MKHLQGASMLLCVTLVAILVVPSAWASECDQKTLQSRNINLLPLQPAFEPGRCDPHFSNFDQSRDSACPTYGGVSFAPNRSVPNITALSARYAMSKIIDNASDLRDQPKNPFELSGEWFLPLEERRNRLRSNAPWELPIGDEKGAPHPQHRGWLTRILGHIEIAPIQSPPLGTAGWSLR